MKRNKLHYFLLIIATIIVGLLSRTKIIPAIIYPYLGDYLYALMFFFIIAFIFDKMDSWKVALISLLLCYSIEILQLYQADWILTVRSYKLGGLILGYGFLWSDIVSYTLGGMTGYFLESVCYKNRVDVLN